MMQLLAIGANFRTAPVGVREALAVPSAAVGETLRHLVARWGGEAVLLSTCNRFEIYLAETQDAPESICAHLAELRQQPPDHLRPFLYLHQGSDAVGHLFRVSASLDSLVLGEAQIAGQVKMAYEAGQRAGTVGPLLHSLFRQARQVARRIRQETGLAAGRLSVSSLAMEYLRQVFDHFHDKTVLVLGAGKMGELTLRHLRELGPRTVLVANRSPEKARQVAASCGGTPLAWEELDHGLALADIILSTTGASEPIISLERFQRILPLRHGRHVAIIDMAVPRDFDPRIADLEGVDLLVNIDDFQAVRAQVLADRGKHVPAAEAIVRAETDKFIRDWSRRRTGPAIARLAEGCDAIRRDVQRECFAKLNGKLSDADRAVIEGALKLLTNRLLHAPISALQEEARQGRGRRLLDALVQLFRLGDG